MARRQELLEQLLQFDGAAAIADRLANRGGVLLREERVRKAVAKEMPKLERELLFDLQVALLYSIRSMCVRRLSLDHCWHHYSVLLYRISDVKNICCFRNTRSVPARTL